MQLCRWKLQSQLHGTKHICSKRPYDNSCYNTFWSYRCRFLPLTLVSTIYCFPPSLLAYSPCNINMPGSPSPPQYPGLSVVSTCHICYEKRQHKLWILMHAPCWSQAGRQATTYQQTMATCFLPTPGRTNVHFSYLCSRLFVPFVTNLKRLTELPLKKREKTDSWTDRMTASLP